MTDQTENLILEHLKRFHAGQERIERKLEEVVSRMDRLNERIERIEKRLELA